MAVVHTYLPETSLLNAAEFTAQYLVELAISGQNIFLLLSGGSSIHMYTKMLKYLPAATDLSHVTISLVDERFGTIGHPFSNEYQLRQAGIIAELEKRGATFFGMLQEDLNGVDTADMVSRKYQTAFAQARNVVLFVGIGEDGHTAGLLPTATAEKFSAMYDVPAYVVYYEVDEQDSKNPHQQRLTISLRAIRESHQVVVYAMGANKKIALQQFMANDQLLHQLPAQALNTSQNPVIILTDQELAASN